jgi:hypothetical protein
MIQHDLYGLAEIRVQALRSQGAHARLITAARQSNLHKPASAPVAPGRLGTLFARAIGWHRHNRGGQVDTGRLKSAS